MQNDVLKNNVAPWQEKGRWYHGVYDCATNSLIADRTDAYLLNTQYFTLGSVASKVTLIPTNTKLRFLDVKINPSDDITRSASNEVITGTYIFYSNGIVGVTITPRLDSGTVEFWVYIRENV